MVPYKILTHLLKTVTELYVQTNVFLEKGSTQLLVSPPSSYSDQIVLGIYIKYSHLNQLARNSPKSHTNIFSFLF
jgi:hypothetical protein